MATRALLRILLVDDDEVDRLAVHRALRAAGVEAEVRDAPDGAAALSAVAEERFDCILLDFHLPGGNGLRVLRGVREAGVDTPVVMLTGHEDAQTAVELMKAGAADYLAKSALTPERLQRSLRTALRLHEAERQTRMAEWALRISEERYRSLVAATAQAVWITDAAGMVVDDAPSWRAFTGQSPEEVCGRGWLEAIHPEDRHRTAVSWEEAVRRRTVYEIEHRVRRFDGEFRYMAARGVPVINADGSVREWVGAHTDVTERRRAEAEREAATQARSRFYAAMSHELRTPINAILGYNDLLLAGIYGPLNPDQEAGLERSQRAARHLVNLVSDVLDLSKLEAGKLEILVEPVSVPELVRDLFATVGPLALERGVELRAFCTGCSAPLLSDPRRVQQILLNLLSNAIKFGAGAPVEVGCHQQADGGVEVAVIDHGVGIEADDLQRIFEEFIQLPSANQEGTGLGLPISKRLAELLGGRLEVESAPGRGSTFRLLLPRAAPPAAALATAPAARPR